jgi:tetratricopeptide (TPR) repeat protein
MVSDPTLPRIQAEIRDVQEKIERMHSSGTTRMSFPTLTLLIVIGLTGLLIYFVFDQTNRMAALKASLREELLTEVQKNQAANVPAESVQRLLEKLNYLELRQTAVIDETRNSIQRQSFVFTTVAAFFGLFTVFFGYRQLFVESRGSAAREQHDHEMRNLVRSFQNNITTISSLIGTLEQSFAYRKQIEDQLGQIQERAKALETHQAEDEIALSGLVESLNRDALITMPLTIDRTALSFDENRRRMEVFVSRLTVAERTRNIEQKLNPFCYYVRGLHNVITYQYEPAITDLDIVARKAREDITEPHLANYPADRRENLQGILGQLLVSCSYFQGLCYKNLGHYTQSRTKFTEALDRNPEHWESRNYLLQVMFFDDSISFPSLEAEFMNANQRFEKSFAAANNEERDKYRVIGSNLKINQGNTYYRTILPQEFRASYQRYENPEKAAQCYWEAFDYLSNDLAHFCLAQALEQVGPSLWRNTTPLELYSLAFRSLKKRVAGDFDKLYSVTLYYMLAICASKLPEQKAAAEVFLSQARHGLKEVATQVTCFSPVCRIRLTRPQILEEMEAFERIAL